MLKVRYFLYPFFAVLLILALITFFYFKNLSATRWLTHTQEVKVAVQRVLNNLQDAEIGQRGYIITQSKTYLEPYNKAEKKFLESMSTLEELVVNNAEQLVLLDSIRQLSVLKFNDMESTINLIEKGDVMGAIAIVRSDAGKVYMDKLRTLTDEMYAIENLLLSEHQEDLFFWRNVIFIIILGSLFVVGISLYLLYKTIKPLFDELNKTKNQLKNVNNNLAESLYDFKKANQDKLLEIQVKEKMVKENQQLVKRLRAKNRRLDQFTHVVANDLSTSLKTVRKELTEIQKHYDAQLPGGAPNYVSTIKKVIKKMEASIKSIDSNTEDIINQP